MRDDPIASKLGLQPINDIKGEVIEHKALNIEKSTADQELKADRDYARQNFYQIIETNARALEEMMEVASQSQHPRAFEVVSTLIKSMAETNRDLVDMAEKKVPKEQQSEAPQEVNNNLIFNGSTKELLEMLKKKNDDE